MLCARPFLNLKDDMMTVRDSYRLSVSIFISLLASTLEPGSHSRARRPSYQNDRSFGTYPRTRQPSGPRRRPEFVHNDNSGVDPVVNGMAGIRRRIDALEAAAANLASQSAEGANVRNGEFVFAILMLTHSDVYCLGVEPVSQTFTLRALSGSRRRIVHRDDGVVETDTPAARTLLFS